MSGRPSVPEDAFRVEGHCCAISLPGIRNGETPVEFAGQDAVRQWLSATYGMPCESPPPEKTAPAGNPAPAGAEEEPDAQSTTMAKGAGVVALR